MTALNKLVIVERIKEVGPGQYQWVPESVAPNIEDDFAIDENKLDYEICRLGQLMAQYGNLFAELKAEYTRKEENLRRAYAVIAQKIRFDHMKADKKITDPTVKEKVECDENYANQQANLQMTRMYAIMAEAWFQSIKKKADLVISWAYKQGREVKAYDQSE